MSDPPKIDASWVIAMIIFGFLGLIVHIVIIWRTIPLVTSSDLKRKGRMLVSGCISMFIFNAIACLIWVAFRTNILINVSIISCKFIYIANFLFYFTAKYILHCILISRTYIAFVGTPYQIKSKAIVLFVMVLSIHFFVTICIWTVEVFPQILKGVWMDRYTICTLFSESAQNTFNVKVCAVLVGVEDFIVGGITLYIILKRFIKISQNTDDSDLLQKSIRYATVASSAMISTLFLFTLAIPFYPNMTFIIAIDATINSLCIFCVLSIGKKIYSVLCVACIFCEKQYLYKNIRLKSLQMVIHSEAPSSKTETCATLATITNQSQFELLAKYNLENKSQFELMEIAGKKIIPLSLKQQYSEPLDINSVNLKKKIKNQRFVVSNPNPCV